MKAQILAALTMVATLGAAVPAHGEAVLDQSRHKPFAVRALGFDKPAYRGVDDMIALPIAKDERDDPEMQVPGSQIWPVRAAAPATGVSNAPPAPKPPLPAKQPEADTKQSPPKGPRIW